MEMCDIKTWNLETIGVLDAVDLLCLFHYAGREQITFENTLMAICGDLSIYQYIMPATKIKRRAEPNIDLKCTKLGQEELKTIEQDKKNKTKDGEPNLSVFPAPIQRCLTSIFNDNVKGLVGSILDSDLSEDLWHFDILQQVARKFPWLDVNKMRYRKGKDYDLAITESDMLKAQIEECLERKGTNIENDYNLIAMSYGFPSTDLSAGFETYIERLAQTRKAVYAFCAMAREKGLLEKDLNIYPLAKTN